MKAAIILPRRHYTQPQGRVQLDASSSLTVGLSAIYLLSPGQWGVELVTQQWRGVAVGSGAGFAGNRLRTSGDVANYVLLPHNLGAVVEAPLSFLVSAEKVSGTVLWSLLHPASQWSGWYSDATGNTKTANLNIFTGSVSVTGHVGVFTHDGVTLRGYGYTESVDATTDNPFPGVDSVALGLASRSPFSVPSVTDFDFFGVYSRDLSADEARALVANPYQIFRAGPVRIYSLPPVLTIPTLSAPGVIDITASSARPQVTLTY